MNFEKEHGLVGAEENQRPGYILLVDSRTCVDIVLPHPATPSLCEAAAARKPAAAARNLAAADRRAQDKVRLHGNYCKTNGYRFVPFAIETFGATHKAARKLIQVLAAHLVGPDTVYSPWWAPSSLVGPTPPFSPAFLLLMGGHRLLLARFPGGVLPPLGELISRLLWGSPPCSSFRKFFFEEEEISFRKKKKKN